MKKLGKLKLNQISKVEMEKKSMNQLRGGDCGCGCHYSNDGGSSAMVNANENQSNNQTSYGGDNFTYSNGTGCWTNVNTGNQMNHE